MRRQETHSVVFSVVLVVGPWRGARCCIPESFVRFGSEQRADSIVPAAPVPLFADDGVFVTARSRVGFRHHQLRLQILLTVGLLVLRRNIPSVTTE